MKLYNFFDSPASPEGRGTENITRHAFVWNNVYSLNSTTIVELRYGLARFDQRISPLSIGFKASTLGFPSYMDTQEATNELRFPLITVNSLTSLGQQGSAGNHIVPTSHNILASITKIKDRHTIKAGFEYRKLFYNEWAEANPAGSFSFDNTWSQESPTQSSSRRDLGLPRCCWGSRPPGRRVITRMSPPRAVTMPVMFKMISG